MGMQQPLTRSAETPGQQASDLGFFGAAYRNRTDDLFITRELHTRKALNWPASAASTKATQLGQHDRTEVVYVQNAPTHRSRLDNYRSINAAGERLPMTTCILERGVASDVTGQVADVRTSAHPGSAGSQPCQRDRVQDLPLVSARPTARQR
jgi:hypothetical protein